MRRQSTGRRRPVLVTCELTVHGPERRDTVIWRVSPPHNVAELSESVIANSFAATLRGGGHAPQRERLPCELTRCEPLQHAGTAGLIAVDLASCEQRHSLLVVDDGQVRFDIDGFGVGRLA
jgi:hypothetical protein